MPHKQAACSLCHDTDALSRATGSVNTLVFQKDGSVSGFNTDGPGFGRAIRTETDTCVVAILDERCSARGRYRQDVLDALPEMPILTEVSDIRQFLCAVKPQSYFEAAA